MDTKIKCILVDDELPGLHYLKTLCLNIASLEITGAYNNPLKVLADSVRLDFDICFVDIEMPEMNGIELARALGKPVIFTTAYKDYAVEAFDLDAIDYLVKPINDARLRQALDKAALFLQSRKPGSSTAILNTDRGKTVIDFKEVLMINTAPHDPRDKQLVYADAKEVMLKNYTFQALKRYAAAAALVQANKKQLIAMHYVRTFTNSEVILETASGFSASVSLSPAYRDDFLKRLHQGE